MFVNSAVCVGGRLRSLGFARDDTGWVTMECAGTAGLRYAAPHGGYRIGVR